MNQIFENKQFLLSQCSELSAPRDLNLETLTKIEHLEEFIGEDQALQLIKTEQSTEHFPYMNITDDMRKIGRDDLVEDSLLDIKTECHAIRDDSDEQRKGETATEIYVHIPAPLYACETVLEPSEPSSPSTLVAQYSDYAFDDDDLVCDILKCEYCDFVTVKSSDMKSHVICTHRYFKCLRCEFESSTAARLKIHVNRKHNGGNMTKCKYCDYESTFPQNLKLHTNSKHTKEKTFKCEHCNYKSTLKKVLKNHVNAKHAIETLLSCEHCDYETTTRRTLVRHNQVKHSRGKIIRCPYCEYECLKYRTMRDHVNNLHK